MLKNHYVDDSLYRGFDGNSLYRGSIVSRLPREGQIKLCFMSLQKIQIWLKSSRGPIDVFLCPEDTSATSGGESSSTDDNNSRDSFSGERKEHCRIF